MYINSSTNIEKLAQEVFWLSESKGFFIIRVITKVIV